MVPYLSSFFLIRLQNNGIFLFFIFFSIHLSLELVGGEKAKRLGKNTIRIKGQDSKPRSLKKWAKTRHRAGSKAYWRRTVRQSLDLTRTPSWPLQRLTTSSLHISYNVIVIKYVMHIKWNEARNFFFPLPKIKQDFSKKRKNEKSPAQQSSTLKRNFKNHFSVSMAQFFVFFFTKTGTTYNLPKQTNKQNKGQKTKTNMHSHPTEMLSQPETNIPYTTLTHTSPVSTQIKNVGMVIWSM